MSSHWRKLITRGGLIRVVGLDATELVAELVTIQGLSPEYRTGLGDAVVGALLIASSHKSNESINLNAKGSGPYRQAIVDASPEGRARGFMLTNAQATDAGWGTGVLSVLYTKNFEGKHPYTGMVPISDGTLATALNEYYRDSEQLISRVALHVVHEGDKVIARGVLIQAVGGASEDELARITGLNEAAVVDLAKHAGAPDFGRARGSGFESAVGRDRDPEARKLLHLRDGTHRARVAAHRRGRRARRTRG